MTMPQARLALPPIHERVAELEAHRSNDSERLARVEVSVSDLNKWIRATLVLVVVTLLGVLCEILLPHH